MKSRLTPQTAPTPEARTEDALSAAERAVEAASRHSSAPAANPGAPAQGSAPLPRRPKGRLPMALLLISAISTGAFSAWNNVFRYSAYGAVSTVISQPPAPWAGTVQAVYVQEGDFVRQGDRIAWLASRDLEVRLEQLEDRRRLARAELIADTSRLWAAAADGQRQRLQKEAEYLEMLGEVMDLESRLEYLEVRETKLKRLHQQRAISDNELHLVQQQVASLTDKVEQWRRSLKKLAEFIDGDLELETVNQIEPKRVELENIGHEIERLRQEQRQGEVRALVSGRIIRRRHFVGDYVAQGEPLIDILPDGAAELIVYLPQRMPRPTMGDEIRVRLAPFDRDYRCMVRKVGAEHRAPPPHLNTRYHASELLLPVFLEPQESVKLVPGQEVRVPKLWFPKWGN